MNGLINHGFFAHLRRDLMLINRRRGDVASPLIFFIIAATLIPLGVSPDPSVLSMIAPGIIWVMALLATMLALALALHIDFYYIGLLLHGFFLEKWRVIYQWLFCDYFLCYRNFCLRLFSERNPNRITYSIFQQRTYTNS